VKKAEALQLLNVNNTELAKILCVSKGHLSRIDDLSDAQVKIVQGQKALEILRETVVVIENLEKERDLFKEKLEQVMATVNSQ
jgi:hypothetical protein